MFIDVIELVAFSDFAPGAAPTVAKNYLMAQTKVPSFDRATLGSHIELGSHPKEFENLGTAACSFLTREDVANWNVSGGECKFIKFLNQPKHGYFEPVGNKPGDFVFHPKSLGKDVVRFVVENTANGRRAIVSLHITVAEPEAMLEIGPSIALAQPDNTHPAQATRNTNITGLRWQIDYTPYLR